MQRVKLIFNEQDDELIMLNVKTKLSVNANYY